ncbi:2-dehydro-3-deoxygalactonokinase [Massilia endophytica]|uniref:2-dehydro-3-deoxygalactonokinase n=1 Tax=Massilia endophytica TaxID=2899220 RepID=UPI001E51EAE1|nr:2-dehydro-3-deoxygalactonokinase [Massilia endophytica]UGQ49152.1 2-dehydro-3-deoxygalactonokinase [Massilia endophytica]
MSLLGVDWGTTNRRAYLLDGQGACVRQLEDERGMLAERGRFAWSLAALRSAIGAGADLPVVLSGMVGSAQGWQEVPYLADSVSLDELPHHLVPVREMAGCFIVPGYARRGAVSDVMRGEETQMLGARALGHGDGWFLLPGTHSKWVRVQDGRMVHWSTYMTGELYAMLARDGTLSALLQNADPEDDADFDAGLALAEKGLPLSHALFTVRAAVVSGAMEARRGRGQVSGLLIGAEFAAARAMNGAPKSVAIIASSGLAPRYLRAAAHFGIAASTLDPHKTYCAAMARFATEGAAHV